MPGMQSDVQWLVSNSRPERYGAGVARMPRLWSTGEVAVGSLVPKSHLLAEEGSYWQALSPTPGTGLATIAAPTTLADTSPFILIHNTSESMSISLDYLRLICTAPGTAGTSIRWNDKIDDDPKRYTSGGSPLTVNMVNLGQSPKVPDMDAYGGPLVASAAASAARLLGGGLIRPVIPVIGDVYQINFGAIDPGLAGLITSGTTISHVQQGTGPRVIRPGKTWLFHLWLPAQSAASSYEVEMGGWQR